MMTTQLPAHLQGRQVRNLTESALTGMSGALPPHISIKGNGFTLVDAAGERRPVATKHLDVCIIDVSDGTSKQYYEYEWEPGSDDPPTCFSLDGVAPSLESQKRQARTCHECQWNVRGSETSKLSGKAIKACRDEKLTAVSIPGLADVPVWQLKVTPGSFKNWKSYVEKCRSQGIDMSLLITRLQFEPDKNGVLQFAPVNWIDVGMADLRDKVLAAKVTDVYVGRGQSAPALVAPAPAEAIVHSPLPAPTATFQSTPAEAPFTRTASPLTPTATPATASPSEPQRRRRRTKAEMEAERAANGPARQREPSAPVAPAAAPVAPFMAEPAPAPAFGLAAPATPTNEVTAALDSFFGPN